MAGRLEPFKQAQDYLPRLKAVFFARWDEDKGCEITYQVPENSIRVTSTAPYHHQDYPAQDQADNHSVDQTNLNDSIIRLDQSDTYSNVDQLHKPQSDFLFEFTDVIDFILPKKHLCGHLVTISSGSAKILGFPTLIEDEQKYDRNFFMFNLCFVFDKDSELLGYEPIVRKTGRVLKSLEQKNSLLSTPNNSTFQIKSILEELYEELNSFSEVSIAINHHPPPLGKKQQQKADHDQPQPSSESDHDELEEKIQNPVVSSTSALFLLNLKLFPFYGNPPQVEDWNVPISLVSFVKLRSEVSWDLTMFKLVPFIDGTATVCKISRLADVDIFLTRECIQHLVFFGCCIITDPFRFSNCYTLVGGRMLDLLGDSNNFESIKLQEELKDYILIKSPSPNPLVSSTPNRESDRFRCNEDPEQKPSNPSNLTHDRNHNDDVDELFLFNNDPQQDYHSSHSISNLLNLYKEFKSGITVHDWMEQNKVHKLNIDVRRFISFGTIKGFLKRLNCYPIWSLHPDLCDQPTNQRREDNDLEQCYDGNQVPYLNSQAYSNGRQAPQGEDKRSSRLSSVSLPQPAWLAVLKHLNHMHPLLSPNLSSSAHNKSPLPLPPSNNSNNNQKPVDRNTDDHKLTTTSMRHTSSTRRSNQNQKKYISSTRKPLNLLASSDQVLSSSHQPHPYQHQQRQHSNQSTFQYLNQHETVAVQVPQDLPLKLNGSHHVDQLCVDFRISFIQLEQILRYIDTLSLLEISHSNSPSSASNVIGSAMHTIYY